MFAHESRIRFFCETKRLYETITVITMITMMPRMIQITGDTANLPFDRSPAS